MIWLRRDIGGVSFLARRKERLALLGLLALLAFLFSGPVGAATLHDDHRDSEYNVSMRRAQTERGAAVISYAELKTQRLPKKTRKLLKRAIKLDEKGATEDALSLVERALASAPTYVEAHTAAAIANLKLDRLDEARRHLHDALEIDRTLLPAREIQGILLYREGKYGASGEVLEDVIERAPGRALAHHFLSVTLRELGELESALQHHQEAERLNRRPFRPRRDPSELERDIDGAGWVR
jgi:tetratricopeptide (TPR) repeat protein